MRRTHHHPNDASPNGAASNSSGGFTISDRAFSFPTCTPLSSRMRAVISVAFAIAVVCIVVTVPPMKAKQFIATFDSPESRQIQKIIEAQKRSQFLGDDQLSPVSTLTLNRKIDLTIYIVFHKVLLKQNYEKIDWSEIALPGLKGPSSSDRRESGALTLTTSSVVTALSAPEGANRTTIIFVATNKNVKKKYDGDLVKGRLLKEWELPGYDSRIGHSMNEFGAMNSIFSSQLTQHAGNIANVQGRGSTTKLVAADADGDGVQEWIGVFQYDMKIDSKLIRSIRRRIVQRSYHSQQPSPAGSKLQQHQLHCCVFFGLSYPTPYLLHNDLGRKLLTEYNEFFATSFVMQDLPPLSILDAFVVPSIVFNHMAPFLESVMLRVQRSPLSYPQTLVESTTSSATGANRTQPVGVGGDSTDQTLQTPPQKHALAVMEAALALALGLETSFVQIQLPIRHSKNWD